ncbi:uncharacterized protein CLUP02_11355 [Colletotrichum lupini]|uniref:Uncharacterized protein n=1 Tax=Colletotrichum lupini TaxID=145971 RepID=A0A9Q8T049_9PEZI|nr:uncharacterized protein CLUP02_11355 [Colletotrichum lupini]UQC85856.1 hypothetical protein CLUP02_11355 [Colletotrichum lupini]
MVKSGKSGPKKILMQWGFEFPPGPILSHDSTAHLVLTAIFGTELPWDENDMATLNREAGACLIRVFNTLVDRADLFGTLRGHPAFYAIVATELNTRGELTGDALKALDEVYVRARRNRQAQTNSENNVTDLAAAVDAWIAIKDAFAALPPLQTLSLTARPNDMSALTAQLQGTDIVEPGQNMPAWPPSHFSPHEIALLAKPDLRAVLFGKTPQNPGASPPLPDKTAMPLETRAFLCSLALAKNEPNSKWTLALVPIGHFKDNMERRQWYNPSGGQSSNCFAVENSMIQAINAFRAGKNTYIALATPWFGRTWGAIPSVDDVPGAQSQQSYGDGVELIIFDPIVRYPHIMNNPQIKASLSSLFSFRQSIHDNTEAAIQRAGGRLIRGWYGGKLEAPPNGADSVQLASEWIRLLVLADVGQGPDPLAVDDEQWAQWGFEEVQM